MSLYAHLFNDGLCYEKPRLTQIAGEWFCRILVDGTDVAGGHTPQQAFRNWQTMLPRYYKAGETDSVGRTAAQQQAQWESECYQQSLSDAWWGRGEMGG